MSKPNSISIGQVTSSEEKEIHIGIDIVIKGKFIRLKMSV
jgi:hypothetical protein